ncbi:tRNA (5-methylaminomethyl-2-thiouridine)(34)-methyltransferase MnmD [Labilibaculum sp. A4]|uniref:tRNA (5-methylaminomethyl-2-thiouridine)(34)-methyltransferase MnmD n=1 Tax=Labilibaculum euxinus TaxID=2686357 RepID=UPI000F616D3A|nr:tRNA (5-methylaminomethyl-2-thiouridine)(34)-methyltransferase MnmD [Labilibaculum euxinus]MDQ1771274.1 tRNA (5-methylaminomethyl-2-thiouridine)(34)-methyltransferase MnmD [Labilibaculum euxinus]MWN77061.1 tRNA (5-methylaminomethyl-2-thiouridine)(34)-methyltransferase MnmD [Labilibaculum euxinus]
MKNLKRELKITEDGSHTLFVPELNEHYHSTHGAIQEAMHVYLNAGFNFCKQDPIHILEIGFGTGLNCFLTLIEAEKQNRTVIYHSIELYPIKKEHIQSLNYTDQIEGSDRDVFFKLHQAAWNKEVEITKTFTLNKLQGDLRKFIFPAMYDLIYFDAFAPDIQPDLWTQDIFEKLHNHLKEDAVLTTYSTKGIIKQALRGAGFEVKRLPGPPGKRQMLRAKKLCINRKPNN